MQRRNPESPGRMQQQVERNVKKCTRDIIQLLREDSNLKIDTIKDKLDEDYNDAIVENSLAKLVAGRVLNINTDIEYSINYEAIPKLRGTGVAK